MAGETESMYIIEKLNDEFDVVVNQNDILKKEIELLKEKLKESECKQEWIKDYYYNHELGPPCCSQCSSLIYYGEGYSEFKKEIMPDMYELETYCKDCTGDTANLQDGWTCEIFKEHD